MDKERINSNDDSQNKSGYVGMMAPSKSSAPLVAGFLGGVVSTTLLLPMDVVKLRLQVDESDLRLRRILSKRAAATTGLGTNVSSSEPQPRPKRLNFFRVTRGILKHEGIRGLYQGWTPAVLGSAISWGGYFYIYENLKTLLAAHRVKQDCRYDQQPLSPLDNFVLAVVSGACMVPLTNPIWLVKTRMQLQMKKASEHLSQQRRQVSTTGASLETPSRTFVVAKPYRSTWDAFRTIVREEGVLALYKGAYPALLLTSHGGVQFVVYEYLKSRLTSIQRPSREEQRDWSITQRFNRSLGFLSMGAIAKV
jgi:solute carrier family 25 (mitochondrial folate transporter), member 32